jgi:hypothetical protein
MFSSGVAEHHERLIAGNGSQEPAAEAWPTQREILAQRIERSIAGLP